MSSISNEMTYCNGKGCALSTTCKRYREGQRIIANHNGDSNQYLWMENCDPESRELYIGTVI